MFWIFGSQLASTGTISNIHSSRGRYYDKKDGLFNKFDSSDLTEVSAKAKNHVLEKIPESGLLDTARSEALEAVLLVQNIVETIGWSLDYQDLLLAKSNKGELPGEPKKLTS